MDFGKLVALGQHLNRPECVLTHASGLVFVSDWTGAGGISAINPHGQCQKLLANADPGAIRPNGIALEPDGCFLLAHLGDKNGGVFKLQANGDISTLVTHANGMPLPPTNFVIRDESGNLWITVSTRKVPRAADYRQTASSGFIAVAEPGNTDARIVADNLGYTNECVIDLERNFVYVNETFARRLSRYDINADGMLSNGEAICHFGEGIYPDGLSMDEEGHLWIASIVSNRIIRIDPNGSQSIMHDDSDAQHVSNVESAFQHNRLESKHLSEVSEKTTLKHASSLAFGGADRRSLYIGNLADTKIHCANVNATGKELPHWNHSLGPLESWLH